MVFCRRQVADNPPSPRTALSHSISALVGVAYAWGPFVRAVADAATTDEWFERTWFAFLGAFDDAVAARIEEQQSAGWIPNLDAHTIAVSLNRLNLSMMIFAFGRRPRKDPKDFAEALTRIWTSTLYAQAPRDGS